VIRYRPCRGSNCFWMQRRWPSRKQTGLLEHGRIVAEDSSTCYSQRVSIEFFCEHCGKSTPALKPSSWRCVCGGPWSLPPGPPFEPDAITSAASGVWRFQRQIRLPAGHYPTLGEGCGRWLRANNEPSIALAHLEPTLSFKDRGVTTLLAWASLAAQPPLIEDSSGNAGGSFAAYAAAAGLPCRIYVPASAPPGKIATLHAFGAEVVKIDGPRVNTTEAAIADNDGTYCSHAWNPMFLEGTKTMAFQWWQEHKGQLPKRIYVPAGQGSIVLGLFYGFLEINAAIPDFTVPAIMPVQHLTASPLWEATHTNGPAIEPRPEDIPSIADGIAIDQPVRRKALLTAVTKTRGRVIVVGNEEIRNAQRRLATMGVWAEPTGAVAMAGHMQVGDGEDALVVVTGHGLKAGEA